MEPTSSLMGIIPVLVVAARVSRSTHCSPYVFRLAETHVFNQLFKFYPAFRLFRISRKMRRSIPAKPDAARAPATNSPTKGLLGTPTKKAAGPIKSPK